MCFGKAGGGQGDVSENAAEARIHIIMPEKLGASQTLKLQSYFLSQQNPCPRTSVHLRGATRLWHNLYWCSWVGLEDGFGSCHDGEAYLFICLRCLELLFSENPKVLLRDAAGQEPAVSLQVAGGQGGGQGGDQGDSLTATVSWVR